MAIRFRAQLRSRWRTWLVLALLAGTLGGLVIAGAAASRRTQGAYQRYLASIDSADVYVDPFVGIGGDTIPLNKVAALPQVARTERTYQLAVLVRSRAGRPILPLGPDSVNWLLPSDERTLDTIDRLKVLRGRLPDPSKPDEVIGDTKATDILGVGLGDTVAIRTVTRRQFESSTIHLGADPVKSRLGPLVRLRVVGVAANARVDVDGGQMHLTPAFLHAHGGQRIAAFIEELVTKLKRGQDDLPAFKRGLARIAGNSPFLFFEPSNNRPRIQHSIDLEARALWLVTVLGALAVGAIVAQAALRMAATESRDVPTLRALGAGAGHELGFAASRAAAIAVPATLIAVLVAYLLSPLAPIGWARELDPRTGFAFEATILPLGAGIVFLVVVASGLAGGVRSLLSGDARPGAATAAPSAGRGVARLLQRHGSPAFAAGLRMALGGRSVRPARGTLAAAALAVTVCVTALVFAASFRHLTQTPRLYGQTWDYETFSASPAAPGVERGFVRDPGLRAVAAGADDTLEINGTDTGVRAWDDLKGHIGPTVISGRAPHAPDEILLGTKTLDAAHVSIGGHVTVRGRGRGRPHRLLVVGRGVLPSSKFNKLGHGGVMTFQALKRIDPAAQRGLYLTRVADGAAGAAALRRLNFYFDGNVAIKPDEVGDFGRIDNMPLYIAALFTVAAVAALAYALAGSVRQRRRDLAILKTIGFTRSQVAAAVAWQATAITAVGVLIGLPLGIGVGRFAWRLLADGIGVAPEVVVPAGLVALVVPGALLVANAVAAVPGWVAARIRPAPVLRTE